MDEAAAPTADDAVERLLLRHGRELLGDELTLDDDLLDVGDSLTLMRLAAAVSAGLGREVAAAVFLASRSLRAIAGRIKAGTPLSDPTVALPPLVPAGRRPDARYPVSAGQRRQMWRRRRYPDMPPRLIVRAWRVAGPLDLAALQAALDQVCGRHEALRTSFFVDSSAVDPAGDDGDLWQQVRPEPRARVRTHRVPPADDQLAAARKALGAAFAPFDWEDEDLIRLHVAVLAEHDHVVLLVVDNLVCDGWSVDLLVRQLGGGYDAAPRVQPPAIQPIDHELWLRSWMDEPLGAPWRQFWSQTPPVTRAPAPDTPRGGVVDSRHEVGHVALERLEHRASELGVSAFALHLTIAGRAAAECLDVAQANVWVALATRRPALSGTVGRFIHPATIGVPGPDVDLAQACRTVSTALRAAIAHQDVPGGYDRQGGGAQLRGCLFFEIDKAPAVLRLGSATVTPLDLAPADPGLTNLFLALEHPRATVRVAADRGIVDGTLVAELAEAWVRHVDATLVSPAAR